MRKLFTLSLAAILVSLSTPAGVASVIPGAKCNKLGQARMYLGKKIICVKTSKGLRWAKATTRPTVVPPPFPEPVVTPQTSPTATPTPTVSENSPYDAPEDLSAKWDNTTLVVSWSWDWKRVNDLSASGFIVGLMNFGTMYYFKVTPVQGSKIQTFVLTYDGNAAAFGIRQTVFSLISVKATGTKGDGPAADIAGPLYVNALPAPEITVLPTTNGYTVYVKNYPGGDSARIQVAESITTDGSSPADSSFSIIAVGTSNPITIYVSATYKRWVRVRFSDNMGSSGPYSAPLLVNPLAVVR